MTSVLTLMDSQATRGDEELLMVRKEIINQLVGAMHWTPYPPEHRQPSKHFTHWRSCTNFRGNREGYHKYPFPF